MTKNDNIKMHMSNVCPGCGIDNVTRMILNKRTKVKKTQKLENVGLVYVNVSYVKLLQITNEDTISIFSENWLNVGLIAAQHIVSTPPGCRGGW